MTPVNSLGIVLVHTGPSESSLLVSGNVLNLFVGRTCLGKFRVGLIFLGGTLFIRLLDCIPFPVNKNYLLTFYT